MNVVERALDGLMVVQNRQFADERGFFQEYFAEAKSGLGRHFVQMNHSRSKPGVVRGLHYQHSPGQGKLVGVIRGRIWDVAVDIRRDSPTRGRHFALELSDANARMLWIPPGFAHGFCVLGEEDADVMYLVDQPYNGKTEGGIRWNEPALALPWPVERPIVSARDQAGLSWEAYLAAPAF